jgi:hypothetical protein
MLRKLGIPVLALAAVLMASIPAISMARDREDHHADVRARNDWHDRDGLHLGIGVYTTPVPAPVPAPAPTPAGYYDQFGIWHPYAYPQYGN